MHDVTTIQFNVDGPGFKLGDAPWLLIREFIDVLSKALAGMPDGPPPGAFRPVRLVDGSVGVRTQVERAHLHGAHFLIRGPTPRWTPAMHRAAQPMYEFLHARRATLKGGQRVLKPVRVPEVTEPLLVRTLGAHAGIVELVGGAEASPKAHIRFEDMDASVVCVGSRDTIKALGNLLYTRVLVKGEGDFDADTGRYTYFRIENFEPLPAIDPEGALKSFHGLLHDEGITLDPKQMLRAVGR